MSRRTHLGVRTQICPRNMVCVYCRYTGFPQLKPVFEGDVMCLHVVSQVVIVLCSVSAIKDLLEKRGETYSERTSLPIAEMYVI